MREDVCERWMCDGGSEQECVTVCVGGGGEGGGGVQTRSCFIPPSSARSTLVSTKTVRCPGGGSSSLIH